MLTNLWREWMELVSKDNPALLNMDKLSLLLSLLALLTLSIVCVFISFENRGY